MPEGTGTFDEGEAPRDLPRLPIGVFRWHDYGPGSTGGWLEPLPHVLFLECAWHEGARPPDCLLRYVVDPTISPAADFERLLPMGAADPLALRHDDRVLVGTTAVDGSVRWIFDGFVELPGLRLSAREASVPIRAVGVAKRLYDRVLVNAAYTPAGGGGESAPEIRESESPIRFNPDGEANCCPDPEATAASGYTYPTFMDPFAADRSVVEPWTLDRAVRYVLGRGNPSEDFVANPPRGELERLLRSVVPAEEGGAVDPLDPSTYRHEPVTCSDRVVSDLPIPEALAVIIAGRGFALKWDIRTRGDGTPETYLQFYPTRDPLPQAERVLLLQPAGEPLDPSRTNLASAEWQRDGSGIVTTWKARIAPMRVEAPFLLLPAMAPAAEDAEAENIDRFRKTSQAGALTVHPDRYRRFRFSEAGSGFWDAEAQAMVGPGNASIVDLRAELGLGRWSSRSRPPLPDRAPSGGLGARLRPRLGLLWAETNEGGESSGGGITAALLARPRVLGRDHMDHVVWIKGGWRLADEELAVVVEAEDPNDWDLGGNRGRPGLNGGRARLIDWLNGTNGATRRAVGLVLVAAIEDDIPGEEIAGPTPDRAEIPLVVDRQARSPSRFAIGRVVDMSDRYGLELRHPADPDRTPGPDPDADPPEPGPDQTHATFIGDLYEVVRDGRVEARDELLQLVEATAFVPFGGSCTIPRLVDAYPVGARIRALVGRDLDLMGHDAGGAPALPRVVSRTLRGSPRQETVLRLDDRRSGS